MYIDFNFYLSDYCLGRESIITSAAFPFYSRKALQYVETYTCGNLEGISDEDIPKQLKICICEIAEYLYTEDTFLSKKRGFSSETVGDYKVSYEFQSNENKTNDKIKEIIYRNLLNTGLLFRGC